MTHAQGPRLHRGADGPDLPRQRMIDRFVALDAAISETAPRAATPAGPLLTEHQGPDPLRELVEAMLIRLLAKHWGWRRTEPGTIQKVVTR